MKEHKFSGIKTSGFIYLALGRSIGVLEHTMI
ncbi:hypothetical protein PS843_01439 [Pseudomonas fluorescens]|nr:hypothetical protein PS843_01439 [Pseudomonas fluorescens]